MFVAGCDAPCGPAPMHAGSHVLGKRQDAAGDISELLGLTKGIAAWQLKGRAITVGVVCSSGPIEEKSQTRI